jgi:hypothetical protein
MSTSDPTQSATTRAVRLIFEYEGDKVRLVSEQPVEMAVTGFDLARVEHPGYYVDIRDAMNRPLARVPVRNAFVTSAEVFPEQPGEPITRVDVAEPRGAFTVVIPASDNAHHVTVLQVVRGKPEVPVPGGPATSPVPGRAGVKDLATFPLSQGGTP